MDVVENKNAAPGNGLTDVVGPTESDPLSGKNKPPPPNKKPTTKGLFGMNTNKNKDKIGESPDPEDPGPSVSESENDQEESKKHRRRRQGPRKDVVGIWAHKCRLTPKRGMIYLLFCGAVILLLIFILFLLAALWPRGPSHDPCLSAQCHRYSANVLGGLNETIEPCTSFYDYSCGGWLAENPLPKSRAYWDVDAYHEFNVKDKLRMLLNTLPSSWIDEPNSVPLKMKRFYDSCMAIDYIDADGEKGLLRIIKSLGGWNVLRDFRASDFDFPRLLRKVQSDHRVFPFFQISVVPDPESPSRNIIKITPSGLSLPHPSYYFVQGGGPMASAFQTFAKDVAQLLGATSYQGGTFAVDMLNFEKRLAEITPDPGNFSDPVTSLHKLSVAELKGMSNTIFWGDLLTTLFPQGNINDQTQVITTSVQYLQDVSGLISTTDKGNLNNYLMWHLTQRYLPYLHKQFTEAVETFRRESIGSSTGPPRWEFCITETIRFFPHGSDFLLAYNRKEERKRTTGTSFGIDPAVTTITDMFQHIKQTVTNRVNEAIKYDESVRNYLLDKLRLMTVQVGNPVGNKSVLEDLYFSVQMQKTDFFPNVVTLIEFQGRTAMKDLAHPNKDTAIINAISQKPFAIQLIPSLNRVIVPQTVLEKEQLYVPDELMALLYGSVGIELSEAIAHSFGPEQGLYLPSGGLLSSRDGKVAEMKDIMESRRSCLSSFFTNIRLDDEPYIDRTSLDSTLHLAGIQIALEAFKTLETAGNFQSLPGIDRPPSALFFLAYGQSQCAAHTMLFHDLEHTTFSSLSHEHKVRGVLRQLVAFTDAFDCSKSSEMYADFTCGHII